MMRVLNWLFARAPHIDRALVGLLQLLALLLIVRGILPFSPAVQDWANTMGAGW